MNNLKKYKKKNPQKIGIIFFTIACILLITGVFLYTSFASFEIRENFNIINGNVQEQGDLYFAFYVDGNISKTMPQKGENYAFDQENSSCTNGASMEFDDETWAIKILNLTSSKTKCTVYFKKIEDLVLFEVGNNAASFYGITGGVKGTIDVSSAISLAYNEGMQSYDWEYLCTDKNFNTENYKYLYFQIESGSYIDGSAGLLGSSLPNSFKLYSLKTLENVNTITYDFESQSSGLQEQVYVNFEPIQKFIINNKIMDQGFCLTQYDTISALAIPGGDSYKRFFISKIWLSNK